MSRDNETSSATFKSDRQLLEEIAGRARRTETKATIIADHLGLDATGQKPVYDKVKRVVWVKTAKISLEEIMEAVENEVVMVQVFCGEKFLASVCPA